MPSLEQMRQDARTIFDAAVMAADSYRAVERHVTLDQQTLLVAGKEYNLDKYRRVLVIGAGKASARMALALENLLGNRISGGIVIVKREHAVPLRAVSVKEAGHPVPDEAGYQATRAVIDVARQAAEEDLIFALISGGGSALLACPAAGITLGDKRAMTQLLLECGATIKEINAIRKHISQVKGGRLARLAFPATVISLLLSDVIGDEPATIASGPTVPDATTFADCLSIASRYGIAKKLPPAVMRFLRRGAGGEVEETPKAGDPVFTNVQNAIVGSNRSALEAARRTSESLGYNSLLLSSCIEGEASAVAGLHAAIAREIIATGNPVAKPACLISGGETTVTVRGGGLGGRNQEFALAAAIDIAGLEEVVVLSGGTDGSDGPTDAAGALADGTTLLRAKQCGVDPHSALQNNDSYHFFQPLGDLLVTGPTFTNVMDLRLVLVA